MLHLRHIALALALTTFAAGTAASQQATPAAAVAESPPFAKNTFFVEVLGNAGLYSLNYERFFTPSLGVRIGAEYVQGEDEGDDFAAAIFPVMATYLLGRGSSHLEAGLGVGLATGTIETGVLGNDFGSAAYGTATLGYRYQPPRGGLVFRVGFTPVLLTGDFHPYGGVSLGYAF